VGLVAVWRQSVRLQLGQVHHGVMAVEVELGLDAEGNPSVVDQLLDLGGPAVVDVAGGVLADLVMVDVLVHQDAWLDAGLGLLGFAQGVADHFLGSGHRHSPVEALI